MRHKLNSHPMKFEIIFATHCNLLERKIKVPFEIGVCISRFTLGCIDAAWTLTRFKAKSASTHEQLIAIGLVCRERTLFHITS